MFATVALFLLSLWLLPAPEVPVKPVPYVCYSGDCV